MRWSLLLILLLFPAHLPADIYWFKGEDGVIHFTNVPRADRPWRLYLREKEKGPTDLERLIRAVASRHGMDPALIKAVIAAESGFDPKAISTKGAKGLMQLMPSTAEILGIRDPFDPEENLEAGTRYLKALLGRFGGDLSLALSAYNAGPEAVERFGGMPPYEETRRYVSKVLQYYARFRRGQ